MSAEDVSGASVESAVAATSPNDLWFGLDEVKSGYRHGYMHNIHTHLPYAGVPLISHLVGVVCLKGCVSFSDCLTEGTEMRMQ